MNSAIWRVSRLSAGSWSTKSFLMMSSPRLRRALVMDQNESPIVRTSGRSSLPFQRGFRRSVRLLTWSSFTRSVLIVTPAPRTAQNA